MYREKHHIVFKSQGGLDFELNYKKLSMEDHRGNFGPHKNRKIDLQYKEKLEEDLRAKLECQSYSIKELIQLLGLKEKQAYRAFRQVQKMPNGKIGKEDILFRLLGGRFYL